MPTEFVVDGTLLKGLPGLLTLLFDAGYTEEEAMDWLYRPDDSLPGHAGTGTAGEPRQGSPPAGTGVGVLIPLHI